MNLHHRPLFLFSIAYIAGIVFAAELRLHPLVGFGLAVVGVLLASILPLAVVKRLVFGILATVFAIGIMHTTIFLRVPQRDVSRHAEGKLVDLTGSIASDPEWRENRLSFVLRAKEVGTYAGRHRTDGRVMVTLYSPPYSKRKLERVPSFGETVQIRERLKKPRAPTNPGAVDYGEHLARKRVYCVISSDSDRISILRPTHRGPGELAARVKAALTARVLDLFPPMHGSLLLGILLGDYAALPIDVQMAFMRSGTMHLLAASGYNCGLVVLIFGYIMRRLTAPRVATHCLLIALVWGFTLVAGPSPSIVRAAVMVTVFLAAYLLKRSADMLNVVLLAGLVILGANPLALYDAGFQLSFAAVLAIITMMPLLEQPAYGWLMSHGVHGGRIRVKAIRGVLWVARIIVGALVISAVAGLGTWPITAYYFNYVSCISIIANAATALLVVLLTIAGIAALSLSCVLPVLAQATAGVGTGIAAWMLGIVLELGSYHWSCLSVASPPPVTIAAYYLVIVGVLEYAYRKAAHSQRVAGDS